MSEEKPQNNCYHTFHRLGGIDDCPDCNPQAQQGPEILTIGVIEAPLHQLTELEQELLDKLNAKFTECEKLREDRARFKEQCLKFDADRYHWKSMAEKFYEACSMGAFHHSTCASNWYSEETKENWDGIGDHRKLKPCTCAHDKIDQALVEYEKFKESMK